MTRYNVNQITLNPALAWSSRNLSHRLITDPPSGSFAFVMATGIVSIAAELLGFRRSASLLLGVNSAGFLALWILTFLRLIYVPSAVIADLCDHRRGQPFSRSSPGRMSWGTRSRS
jgi:hypothetical protein